MTTVQLVLSKVLKGDILYVEVGESSSYFAAYVGWCYRKTKKYIYLFSFLMPIEPGKWEEENQIRIERKKISHVSVLVPIEFQPYREAMKVSVN